MPFEFRQAIPADASTVGTLAFALTEEICARTNAQHFDIDLERTIKRCEELLSAGHYAAIIACSERFPIAVATFTETYALYAGGKVGIIQEFFVSPKFKSTGVGSKLIGAVRDYGLKRGWSCMELCTPPLPEFERTLQFYKGNGLIPVGGRKMRLSIR